MSEPQVWVFMGLFSTTIIAVIGILGAFVTRVVGVETGSLRTELALRFENVDRGFNEVNRRCEQIDRQFEGVGRRFDRMAAQVDGLDRDVRYPMRRRVR